MKVKGISQFCMSEEASLESIDASIAHIVTDQEAAKKARENGTPLASKCVVKVSAKALRHGWTNR